MWCPEMEESYVGKYFSTLCGPREDLGGYDHGDMFREVELFWEFIKLQIEIPKHVLFRNGENTYYGLW
jgi:hypothetical protein